MVINLVIANGYNIVIYFENLTVGLHVVCILNIYVKFQVNRIIFIEWSINFFLLLCIIIDYKNLKFKHLIDDITINFLFLRSFASMDDMRSKYNLIMDLSKFRFNEKNIE